MSESDNKEWLHLGEAAALLGVHPSTLREWADQGEVRVHRTPGNHRRFRRSDIETWAALRRETHPNVGQMVVQNALGRTRMQMAEGRLKDAPWYQGIDETRKREFREIGRRLLNVLLRYLSDDDPALLAEGQEIGCEYERLGREAGLVLGDTVNIFLYFRDFLYESVIEMQAANQHTARDWVRMHQHIAAFTNAVLIALIEAHQCGR